MEATAEDGSAAALPQSEMPRPSSIARVTWEGCSVLLDINDGDRLVFARLSPNATLKIGNKKCSLRPLLGCPFGSLFRVETGSSGPYLSRCVLSSRDDCAQDSAGGEVMEDIRDNRLLIDNNTAQSLSSNDIDAMRSVASSEVLYSHASDDDERKYSVLVDSEGD